ncbi:uncharacterized protein K02A2.6-like [Uranotaenia lowii]|uniref:uncharacterized protein K02A2.6-like n=1 Tax=Uranotaenia lowii TaxID=190385 RepID=UPI0024794606|nr:uncharacterized protein K02A2.6-like [Uranotaenia lowii]
MSRRNGNPVEVGDFPEEEGDVPAASMAEVMRQMANQNSRLMALLEQFTGGANPAAQRGAPEQIIESLSTAIKEFHFDPENGLTFDRWFSKYEDLFRQDGRNLDDPAKVRLLLRSLSVPVHEKFLNYLLPDHPRNFTFDEVVDKLKAIFGQQKSLFSKRYDCLQIIKNEADDFVTYAGAVNRQCEEFELQRLTANQFKSLVFICGLKSAKDADIRTRLLSKLESDAAEINIDGLVTECQRLTNLKHDVAMVEKKHSSSMVQAVRQFKKQSSHQSKQPPPANDKVPPSPCWQCGAMHFVKDCNFAKHTCKQCGKIGHREGYCSCSSKFSASSSAGDKRGKPKNRTLRMKTIQLKQIRSRRRYLTVDFNGVQVKLQLDCGSDISVVSQDVWNKIGGPTINATQMQATTASGGPLELLGEFTSSVTISNVTREQQCYVTSVNNLNVIGLDWMDAFDLWSKPLAAQCNQVNLSKFLNNDQHFLTRFPEVFQNGLGHCTKTKVGLNLKPGALPVFRPKRPVPFHATQKVDEELERLQRLDIITPIDFSDWAAPIVVVKKPGGKVRICADYSTGLNAALEANNYPLPTPEDIFTKLAGNPHTKKLYLK